MAKRKTTSTKPPWIADTRVQVREFFGIQHATLQGWLKSGCPTGPPYDLRAILQWRDNRDGLRAKTRAGGGSAESKDELEKEKLRLDNEMKRLKLRQTAGELVDRGAAKAEFTSLLHRIRGRLEQLPHELASVLPADQRADYVHDCQHKVRLVCREMENWSGADA